MTTDDRHQPQQQQQQQQQQPAIPSLVLTPEMKTSRSPSQTTSASATTKSLLDLSLEDLTDTNTVQRHPYHAIDGMKRDGHSGNRSHVNTRRGMVMEETSVNENEMIMEKSLSLDWDALQDEEEEENDEQTKNVKVDIEGGSSVDHVDAAVEGVDELDIVEGEQMVERGEMEKEEEKMEERDQYLADEIEPLPTAPFVLYSPRVDSEKVYAALQSEADSRGGVGQLESDDDTSPSPSPRYRDFKRSGDLYTKLRLKGFLYQLTSFHQPKQQAWDEKSLITTGKEQKQKQQSKQRSEKGKEDNASKRRSMRRYNSATNLKQSDKSEYESLKRYGTMAHAASSSSLSTLTSSSPSSSKSPSAVGPWVKRYFALTQDTLYVFASPLDRKALHFIECASIYRVERLYGVYKRREYSFAVRTYGRTYMFSAESEMAMEKWVIQLLASMRDCATESINHSFRHLLNAYDGDSQPFVETIMLKMLSTVPEWNYRKMFTDVTRILQYMVNRDKEAREQQQEHEDEEMVNEKMQSWEIKFDAIKLGKKLAEGFFGEVFKGTAWGKTCAIKRLKLSNSVTAAKGNEKLIKKLKQEAALMAELRHPNVLLFIGLCTDPNNTLLVMEFASGGSLYDILQNNHINDATLFRIISDICLGMNYLHQRNILHLDLKPLNLLADDHFNIKVSDFGISRILKSKDENVHGPTGYGTVLYMADELIYGPSYGKSADVFSFGVTLFELLWIREHPETNFVQEDSIGFNLLREPIAKKRKPIIPAWWPEVFKTLVTDCCSEDPSARPSFERIISAFEMLQNVTDDWWLARYNSRRIRELSEDHSKHQALTDFDIWQIMNNYLMQTKDELVHWNILVAMIELGTDSAEQNPAVLLNEVIERLETLVESPQTLVRLQEVIAHHAEFKHFSKLIESDFVVSLSKERVLAIILRLIENEKVLQLFLEQGIVRYFAEKFSNRLHIQNPLATEKQHYNRHRNRSFVVTGIQNDFVEKLIELPIAQILQRMTLTDNSTQLQRVVDDGGIDILVYLSTEANATSSANYETVFIALQTLADLSIKDSKLATIIEGKGVKPVQLATRAYLGALLRSNKRSFVNVKPTMGSDIESSAFDKPSLRAEGKQVLPLMKLSFHRARERFNTIIDDQRTSPKSGSNHNLNAVFPSFRRHSDSPLENNRNSTRRLSKLTPPRPRSSDRTGLTTFSTLTEILGQNTGNMNDEPVIVKLWEMLKEEEDLDNIDCMKVRQQLEAHFKSAFEDQKRLVEIQISQVVGQMDTPSQVTPYLYLGSEWNSTNLSELKSLGIGYIVNVGAECPCYYPQHFTYANIKITSPHDFSAHISEVIEFIKRARDNQDKVLVHSHFGVSRSAAFVIAYLMHTNRWTLQKSYKYVRDIRSIAQPHREYMRQLIELEYDISGQNSLGTTALGGGHYSSPLQDFSGGGNQSSSPRSALNAFLGSRGANSGDSNFSPGSPNI